MDERYPRSQNSARRHRPIDPMAFERRVLADGMDQEFLAWMDNGASPRQDGAAQWNQRLLSAGPADDAALQRFQGRLQDIARERKVPVSVLPSVCTWADLIELDEERL